MVLSEAKIQRPAMTDYTAEQYEALAWAKERNHRSATEIAMLRQAAQMMRQRTMAEPVTDEEVNAALATYFRCGEWYEHAEDAELALHTMRAALESFAAGRRRVPDGLRERIEKAWHNHDDNGRVTISMRDTYLLVEQVLAAAPKVTP